MTQKFSSRIRSACSNLLVYVADADNVIESEELDAIHDILKEFLSVDDSTAIELINQAIHENSEKKDLFSAGEFLNDAFDDEQKIDFLYCIYELGYSDGSLHNLEQHIIRQIANVLHIENQDLIQAKIEVRDWFSEPPE